MLAACGVQRAIRLGGPNGRRLFDPRSFRFAGAVTGADDLATLQYTGGTTGRSKGVNLTHRAVATNVAQRDALLPSANNGERILCTMPLFHSYASAMCLHNAANCGGAIVILPKFAPEACSI